MRALLYITFFTGIFSMLFSCEDMAPAKETYLVDSLNRAAYALHYRDLDSSYTAAKSAYDMSRFYRKGKAEAANNLGFNAFMAMNFEVAEAYFNEVYQITENETELLIADVGMMKICQRAALYKEFYDYRNSALQRIKRINEDKTQFIDKHEKRRLNYAYTEFSIVSAIYYYYLQQLDQAQRSINEIKPEQELSEDMGQLLYYHYIKGASSLGEEFYVEQKLLNEFDELFFTWQQASTHRYPYFVANGLQGLANLLIPKGNFNLLTSKRINELNRFDLPVDSTLSLRLAQKALEEFRRYNDIYQIAGTYVTIGRYLNERGEYTAALDTLTKALEYVNLHHKQNYEHGEDAMIRLEPYVEGGSIYTEVLWMSGKDETHHIPVKTVPEWISRIREQLSVSFSGLGMKFQSDYNRNIYLEILKYTRQDKELENRYDLLRQEEGDLNILMCFILAGLLIFPLLLYAFNRKAKTRELLYSKRLQTVLDICHQVTASIPADIAEEEEIPQAISNSILPEMQHLVKAIDIIIQLPESYAEPVLEEVHKGHQPVITTFDLFVPAKKEAIARLLLLTARPLLKEELMLVRMITPAIAWTIDNGMTFIALGDEREQLEKQRYVIEQHIAKGKRENIIKKSCLAIVMGIVPYIDRITHEVSKLKEKRFYDSKAIREEKYHYVQELVEVINEHNDILALWIKLKQGSLHLNIENFELNELFMLVTKGRKTFEMRRQTLEVEHTEAIVKADKALTLFMINTLAENARKFTQPGGNIRIYAHATDKYVEISIEDNGRGLSEEDILTINQEKIYDTGKIGVGCEGEDEELKRAKGYGYGLMNCKGIIEKYRKSNSLFDVCMFKVESTLGKGSRFFFRLPMGTRKLFTVLVLLGTFTFLSCNRPVAVEPSQHAEFSPEDFHYELIKKASDFTDTAYNCNVMEEYELALQYIDSAVTYLNNHYILNTRKEAPLIMLEGSDSPAELLWWEQNFNTDYYVIMDLRNAAAVSFLALKQWQPYTYNNKAFTAIYKLTGEDRSLEAYCKELERSTSNKTVGIIISMMLIVSYIIIYYFVYVRKRVMNRWRLEHVLEVNKTLFSSSILHTQHSIEALQREEDTLKEIPRKIIEAVFDGLNEWLDISQLSLAIYNEVNSKWEFASTSEEESLHDVVEECFINQHYVQEENLYAFPLLVEVRGGQRCVGVLSIKLTESQMQENDFLLLELVARYVAIIALNAVVKLANRYRDIESAFEDTHRASWEDQLLHVQNLVLDNCLSTIKHETIYYPNKIKQIVDKITTRVLPEQEEKESIEAMSELIDYYKGIFSILSSNASRQLEEVTFRRTNIGVPALMAYAQKYFKRSVKSLKEKPTLEVAYPSEKLRIVGDVNLMQYMFENLIQEALEHPEKGALRIEALEEEEYVRFVFTDTRRQKAAEELNNIFYPNLKRMTLQRKSELSGTEFLICKQIIREHDEFAGRRGCRINAEPSTEGGFTIYFTLPKR